MNSNMKQASKAQLTKIFNAAGLPLYTGKDDGLVGYMIHEERHSYNTTTISWSVGHRNAGWEFEKYEMICEMVAQIIIADSNKYFVEQSKTGGCRVWVKAGA